jgi:hypothetical protein
VVLEDRNKDNKDWMYKGVEIPKVRAHLFARLCLASAEHAAKAQALLGRATKVDDSLTQYVDDLRRTAKSKACRFLGVDAELAGKTGEGIAWLRGARKELGFAALGEVEEKKSSGFSKLKKDWQEKREDRKIEKGEGWGTDAGKFEEGRVVNMLLQKWNKMNDTVCSSLEQLLSVQLLTVTDRHSTCSTIGTSPGQHAFRQGVSCSEDVCSAMP